MAQRLGSVIVFKEGVTEGEAAHALSQLANFIELPEGGNQFKILQAQVREFDDDWGGPVWYIP